MNEDVFAQIIHGADGKIGTGGSALATCATALGREIGAADLAAEAQGFGRSRPGRSGRRVTRLRRMDHIGYLSGKN